MKWVQEHGPFHVNSRGFVHNLDPNSCRVFCNRFRELEHVVGVVICAGAVEEELDGGLGLRRNVMSDVSKMHSHHTSACEQHQHNPLKRINPNPTQPSSTR